VHETVSFGSKDHCFQTKCAARLAQSQVVQKNGGSSWNIAVLLL
jgi:hypothetical protein